MDCLNSRLGSWRTARHAELSWCVPIAREHERLVCPGIRGGVYGEALDVRQMMFHLLCFADHFSKSETLGAPATPI